MAGSDRRRSTPWCAKNLTFACIGLMTAYVIFHNERFLIDRSDPNWAHIHTFRWWLLVHGLAGAPALLLAPLQFSNRLRARYVRLHHIVGYIYVTGVFVLGPLGAYIQWVEERIGGTRSFSMLAAADAVLLLTTTGIALYFAVAKRITPHRQWMTRSYAVALVFFEGRLVLGLTGIENMSSALQEAVIWSCLVFAFLLADIANHWGDFRAVRAAAERSRARVAPDAVGAIQEPA